MSEEDDDVVRLENEGRHVWLVKVPPRVAKAWDSTTADDALLGKMQFHTTGQEGEKPRITFHSSLSNTGGAAAAAAASDFTLNFNDTLKYPMRIFSKGDGGVEMQGVVEHTFFMQPLRSEEYEKLVQKRVASANEKTRVTRGIDGYDVMRATAKNRVLKTSEESGAGLSDAKRRKIQEGDEGELREVLFSLFSKRDHEGNIMHYWTMKDLKQETGASEKQLRPLLTKLCIFHRDGEFARCYELKPEFATS